MAFSRQAFSQEERDRLKLRIKELEEEIFKLKAGKEIKKEKVEIKKNNKLEDMLC